MRERLAQIEQQRLEADLKKNRQVFGAASLASTEALRRQGDKLRRFDEARHAQWMARLDSEAERTRKVMETVRARFDQTPEADIPARLDLMKSLALLGGPGSEEEKVFLQAQSAAKEGAYQQGAKAHSEGRHGEAGAALEFVVRLDPAYKDAGKLLLLSKIGAIEGMWAAAEDDAARGRALQLLKQTIASPEYVKHVAEAAPAAARLPARNLELVKRALEQGRLIEAIGGVLRGRQIAAAMGSAGGLAEEKALLERLRQAAAASVAAGLPALGYAYQRVANELIPGESETRRLLAESRSGAEAATPPVVRVAVASAQAERSALAEALRTRIVQSWPAGIVQAGETIRWVDWVLQVKVTDAAVESDERKGRKLVRAPGGSEDIGIELRLVRKRAHLSISIVLADAERPDAPALAETFRSQAEDEAHDGLQVGGFSVLVKLAELPADVALLDKLAIDAADFVLARLAETRSDRPRRLTERAAQLARAGQGPAAANALALAALLKEMGGQPAKAEYDRAQLEALQVAPAVLLK
jgi:hypothetical protein